MKILPCAVRSALSGVMIAIGGYAFLGCENRVVGAILFTVGLITITLFGFDLYTGRIGYFYIKRRGEGKIAKAFIPTITEPKPAPEAPPAPPPQET